MKIKQQIVYDLFILVLSLLSLTIILVQSFWKIKTTTNEILNIFDFVICMVFLADFFKNLWEAESKREYMKWGWIDLISSIPNVDFLRYGRLARVLRILKLLRGIKSLKHIVRFIINNRAKASFLTLSVVALVLLIFSSITIMNFEQAANANIKTPEDAIWWSFVTITTVGYGDFYPVTLGGRLLAAALMIIGIGLFGTFTGLVGAWFVQPYDDQEDRMDDVIRRLDLIQSKLRELEGKR